MKKAISLLSAFLIILTVMCNVNVMASAAVSVTTVKTSHLKTVFSVPNYRYDTALCTNIGGISVGTANNRLFVVKSNSTTERRSTLYYYNNIYNEKFKTGDKKPKRIVFTDFILGHANAMAIDDRNVYVTAWGKKDGTDTNALVQISRKAVTYLNDGDVVSLTDKTVTDSDGNVINVYNVYEPEYEDGTPYDKSIHAITRYSYDKTNNITKFIINYSYSSDRKTLKYTIATLKDGKFTVSTSPDDMFTVQNPKADVTMQDIFYDTSYGMLIPVWDGGTSNYVLCVDIKGLKTQGKTSPLVFEPYKILGISRTSDDTDTLTKYEMESIALVKKNADKETSDFRLIFSCNKADAEGVGCDAIEEVTPLSTYLTKL